MGNYVNIKLDGYFPWAKISPDGDFNQMRCRVAQWQLVRLITSKALVPALAMLAGLTESSPCYLIRKYPNGHCS